MYNKLIEGLKYIANLAIFARLYINYMVRLYNHENLGDELLNGSSPCTKDVSVGSFSYWTCTRSKKKKQEQAQQNKQGPTPVLRGSAVCLHPREMVVHHHLVR